MKLVVLGPPGAGKGSLAMAIKAATGVAHISTGDLLREEMKNESDLGLEAKKFIDSGDLVPDELVTRLVENKLKSDSTLDKGYMLDGFPRTEVQAKDLNRILKGLEKELDYAIYLEASLPIILKRLTGRRVCRNCGALFHMTNKLPKQEGVCDQCGGELYQRADDNEETIKTRMDVYLKNTKPITDYYRGSGILKEIDGDAQTEDLQRVLTQIFDGR